MTEKLWCSKNIVKGWHRYNCSKSATVTRNGKLYCGTHDPEKVAAREQKRELQQDNEGAKLKDLHDRAVKLMEQLGAGRPDGNRYDKRNPIHGIVLTFTEAEHLILRLQRGGQRGGSK